MLLVDAVSSICSLVGFDVALHSLDWSLQEKRHYKVREGLSFEVNFWIFCRFCRYLMLVVKKTERNKHL
jgi:hypothetical protein